MSFLYINDPKKRNEIVADYLASVKKTRQQRTWEDEEVIESKKTGGLLKQPAHCNPDDDFKFTIQFLPGDISGLQTKLTYLLAEYQAGNTFATRNQIVAIADELLRRRQLSQEQYDNINSIIQQQQQHIE